MKVIDAQVVQAGPDKVWLRERMGGETCVAWAGADAAVRPGHTVRAVVENGTALRVMNQTTLQLYNPIGGRQKLPNSLIVALFWALPAGPGAVAVYIPFLNLLIGLGVLVYAVVTAYKRPATLSSLVKALLVAAAMLAFFASSFKSPSGSWREFLAFLCFFEFPAAASGVYFASIARLDAAEHNARVERVDVMLAGEDRKRNSA